MPQSSHIPPIPVPPIPPSPPLTQVTTSAPPPSLPPVEAAPAPKVLMKLDRHYRPAGPYEIVGHWTPMIERKNPVTNKMEIIQKAAFHEGEPMPPPQAGVGSQSLKIWAGTVIRLTTDEAKRVRTFGIGTVEVDDAA